MIRQHSSFKYFRVKQRTNLDELSQIIEYMNTDKDVFIQGHIFDPLIDSKTRFIFLENSLQFIGYIRFTIVWHPLERALSYVQDFRGLIKMHLTAIQSSIYIDFHYSMKSFGHY